MPLPLYLRLNIFSKKTISVIDRPDRLLLLLEIGVDIKQMDRPLQQSELRRNPFLHQRLVRPLHLLPRNEVVARAMDEKRRGQR